MADKKISQLTAAATPLTGTEQLPLVQGGVTLKATAQDIANLVNAGIGGTNYIYVMADGTDVENAAELSAAYTAAIALSPSATNRITIVAGPGYYNFGSSAFTMDTQYIDLVSLDGNRSVLFNSANAAGTISITANDVFVKGVDVGTKAFTIATSLNLLRVENCKGGNESFGFASSGMTVSGTFTNCVGGNNSFGAYSGSQLVTVSGTFINCVSGNDSFGYGEPKITGIFTNCVAGSGSFGLVPMVQFIDGFEGTATNCVAGDYSFGGGASGVNSTGVLSNCVAGTNSFGGGGGPIGLKGKLYYCRMTSGTFGTVSGSGITRLCLDGSNVENNQG